MKICLRCKHDLPLYAFTKDKSRPDGLFVWCSKCKSESRKAAYLAAHPDRKPRKAERLPSEMVYKDKLCIDCLEMKPISHFHRKRDAADGHTPYCMPCGNARSIAWQSKNKGRLASKRYAARQANPRHSINVSLYGALKRCPTEDPATIDDIMKIWKDQSGRCAVSGIQMTWAKGSVLSTSITLDRIDPFSGYTASNIRLVCHAVNAFRGRMSDDEMFTMALAIVANMKKPKLRLVG